MAAELAALSRQESDEPAIELALDKFASAISEIEKSRKMMLRQIQDVFLDPLDTCLKRDISNIKESKKTFEKMSDNIDSSLDRYFAKRSKDLTIPEAADELAQSRREFHERSIRYSNDINDFQFKKRADVIENFLAYMYTNFAFFHQGYEILKELEPTMRDLNLCLQDIRSKGDEIHEKAVQDQIEMMKCTYHSYSPIPLDSTIVPLGSNVFTKSGYLVKRGSGKITQVWSRRWFFIRNDFLLYTARGKDEQATIAANLRLCSVKPHAADVGDRRFCFELFSPVKYSRIILKILYAENEKEVHEWVEVLQNAIGKALNSEVSPDMAMKGLLVSKEKLNENYIDISSLDESTTSNESANFVTRYVHQIKKIPGNQTCADCGLENPEWASINLGLLLCIECSGIHRSLGVQISKVRSMTLDKLEPELYEVMLRLGNDKVNSIFEEGYTDSSDVKKPKPDSDRSEKEAWINAKYVIKRYLLHDFKDQDEINERLWDACVNDRYCDLLKFIAIGGSIDFKNVSCDGKTPLIEAIGNDNDIMAQYLINMNANVNLCDDHGSSCLHYAVDNQNEKLVKILLKRHVNVDCKDDDGRTPIDIALERADPEIVTALRMFLFEKDQNTKKVHESEPVPVVRNLPSPPHISIESEDESISSKSKTSPNKIKNFFSTSNSGTAKLASPKSSESITGKQLGFSSTLSSASSYANHAVASASKYFKNNFTRVPSEMSPVHASSSEIDDEFEDEPQKIANIPNANARIQSTTNVEQH